jgi:dihydroorotate dehydrogenase electron transfer subunit
MDVSRVPVLYNQQETPTVFRLGVAWDALARGVRPAQFVMLADPDWSRHLIPRPFSVSDARRDEQGREVAEFLYKPLGTVTRRLAELQPGQLIDVGGICGNGFPRPSAERRPVLIAGGIGNAPFALQVRSFLEDRNGPDPKDAVLFLGGRTGEDVYIQDVVRSSPVRVIEATEDGSRGERGRVTEAFVRMLGDLQPVEVFACGPTPMLRAVQELAIEHGFPAHLALEAHMACGYGVCNACVTERRSDGVPQGEGPYLRLCVEGPVCEARQIWI